MSEKSGQPSGGYEPSDPWAPPERGAPLDKPPPQQPQPSSFGGSVHDQPTIIGAPGSDSGAGSVPPPPTAPGGPARPVPGPYGYPGAEQPAPPYGGTGVGAGYGYPGYPAPYAGPGPTGWQQGPANGMGITALVLGILAVVTFCFWGLGIVLGILALIFGFIGRGRARRGEANNAGMALAGIILGAIGSLISAAFLGFLIWAIANEGALETDDGDDPFAVSLVVGVGSHDGNRARS
jgi:hypothetical protein